MFRRVGTLLDAGDAAEALIARFDRIAAEVARRRQGKPRPRVLHLEWFDPPFLSGHWNPDLIALAGGDEVLGRSGEPSRRASWEEIAEAAPEVVLLAPCGFTLERSATEQAAWSRAPSWRDLPAVRAGRVVLADGSAYFSRPGPRLAESLAVAAAAIDPAACGDLAPADGWRRWAEHDG